MSKILLVSILAMLIMKNMNNKEKYLKNIKKKSMKK